MREFILLPREALDLPVDIQGTAFQASVWKALRKIPLGSTRSYTEVAESLGKPGAARAVASACAGNKDDMAYNRAIYEQLVAAGFDTMFIRCDWPNKETIGTAHIDGVYSYNFV